MNLFNNLMNLCENSESFFFKDFEFVDGDTYRIFNYRLVGWEEFHNLPAAMECRGIMFKYIKEYGSWHIISRPMEKFFNAHEGAVAHDYSTPMSIMTKEDGSLISTFLSDNKVLRLKSKGSLFSTQVREAEAVLDKHPKLEAELKLIEQFGYTVNMEYTSPTNRIVLSYPKPNLVILNFRERFSGDYCSIDYICKYMLKDTDAEVRKFMVQDHYVSGMDMDDFVSSIPDMTGIEGFVIQKNNGEFVKIKTTEYITLHHSKDSVNNPKALYEVAIEDATDDLRTLFEGDQYVLDTISKMEEAVDPLYNHMIVNVEGFYSENKDLDRKEYAITAQNELVKYEFGLAMNLYLGKTVDYKTTMKKRWSALSNHIIEAVYGVGYEY